MTTKRPFLLTTNACVPELPLGSSLPPRILMRTLWREISELLSLWTTGRISLIPPPHWEGTLYTICQTSVRNAILWKWSWKIRLLLPPRATSAMKTMVFLRPATCMTETSAIPLWSHLGIMVRPKWCKQPWPPILATLTSLNHSPCSSLSLEALHLHPEVILTANEFETRVFFFPLWYKTNVPFQSLEYQNCCHYYVTLNSK